MNKENLGLGVMLSILSGNQETVDCIKNALGKKIAKIALEENHLHLEMEDGFKFMLFDDGQSCCESRYMVCDDKLQEFVEATLVDINIKDSPDIADPDVDSWGGNHEVQFLELSTDRGAISIANHNEHNGYYGGFSIKASKE